MDFALSDEQRQIREQIAKLCSRFDDNYWRAQDEAAAFPEDFYRAVAKSGWLGVAMPESCGGAGLGISEAAVMMRAIAESGAGMAGASSVHMNIFGLQPVVAFGTPDQQARMLPPIVRGEVKACFAVTEPDTGLDTTRIKTTAAREGEHYLVSGQKIWISTAQVASRVMLLARTTPLDAVKRRTDGLSLFYTPIDRAKVEIRAIRKLGRHAVDSNMMFFDGMRVPVEDRIGAEGEGFRLMLHGFNPERILIAAEAVGIGFAALARAAQYAKTRVVFGRPIGMNQGIQHPLARHWMELEAANLMVMKAAGLYDRRMECGAEANAAKYLAAEAGFAACETAVMTHGGMGYSSEYHVERYLRESLIPRIAPVSPQMILNYIGERILGLPKSY
ncbi:MAG: acyl-CoA/acyl-ACP dehydrogenase [Alphaproteobacteria bacterium]|nr:acyl-CoA/acyl-ACP dehydrogenase [Alphaproteobacteria bacterium]